MTTKPPSPSPSPPPKAPIPLQPGPRALRLQEVQTGALSATLKSITLKSFLDCFPTLAKTAPDALRGMHTDLLWKLERFAKDEFEKIMVERKVVEALNGLERVIEEGKRRKEGGGEVPVA